jgi:hypothetical protein
MDAGHDLLLVADQRDPDVNELLQGHLSDIVETAVAGLVVNVIKLFLCL